MLGTGMIAVLAALLALAFGVGCEAPRPIVVESYQPFKVRATRPIVAGGAYQLFGGELVFLENGIAEKTGGANLLWKGAGNGFRAKGDKMEMRWELKGREIFLAPKSDGTPNITWIYRVQPNGDLTRIAEIVKPLMIRKNLQKADQITHGKKTSIKDIVGSYRTELDGGKELIFNGDGTMVINFGRSQALGEVINWTITNEEVVVGGAKPTMIFKREPDGNLAFIADVIDGKRRGRYLKNRIIFYRLNKR